MFVLPIAELFIKDMFKKHNYEPDQSNDFDANLKIALEMSAGTYESEINVAPVKEVSPMYKISTPSPYKKYW